MAIAESVAVKVGDTVMTDFVGFQAARQKFRPRCTGCQNQRVAAAISSIECILALSYYQQTVQSTLTALIHCLLLPPVLWAPTGLTTLRMKQRDGFMPIRLPTCNILLVENCGVCTGCSSV